MNYLEFKLMQNENNTNCGNSLKVICQNVRPILKLVGHGLTSVNIKQFIINIAALANLAAAILNDCPPTGDFLFQI